MLPDAYRVEDGKFKLIAADETLFPGLHILVVDVETGKAYFDSPDVWQKTGLSYSEQPPASPAKTRSLHHRKMPRSSKKSRH